MVKGLEHLSYEGMLMRWNSSAWIREGSMGSHSCALILDEIVLHKHRGF